MLKRSYWGAGGERTPGNVCKGDICAALHRAALRSQAHSHVLHMILRILGLCDGMQALLPQGPARKLEPSQTPRFYMSELNTQNGRGR